MSNYSPSRRPFVWTSAGILILGIGGPTIDYFASKTLGGADFSLASCLAGIALITFLGMFVIGRATVPRPTAAEVIRDCISASFVLVYLTAVCWTTFFSLVSDDSRKLAPLTTSLLPNFTILTGTIIAFYFGSQAAEKIAKVRAAAKSEEPDG